MPLIHKKTPAAFKKNIEIEMAHGKPQKQAVAIAYSVKDKAGHHKYSEGGCIGVECPGCSDAKCYAGGGQVTDEPTSFQRSQGASKAVGVHGGEGGGSMAGGLARAGKENSDWAKSGQASSPRTSAAVGKDYTNKSKEMHREKLSEMKSMKKPNLYAHGGCIGEACEHESHFAEGGEVKRDDKAYKSGYGSEELRQRGVNGQAGHGSIGVSGAGMALRRGETGTAKSLQSETLSELRGMKKPNLYAEGGEVHEDEHEDHGMMDDEMRGMLGDELLGAFEAKDKKRIMEGIEALVLSIMSKG